MNKVDRLFSVAATTLKRYGRYSIMNTVLRSHNISQHEFMQELKQITGKHLSAIVGSSGMFIRVTNNANPNTMEQLMKDQANGSLSKPLDGSSQKEHIVASILLNLTTFGVARLGSYMLEENGLLVADLIAALPATMQPNVSYRKDGNLLTLTEDGLSPVSITRIVKTRLGSLLSTYRTVCDTSLKEMADYLGVAPSRLSDLEFGRSSNLEQRLPDMDAFFASKGLTNTLTNLQFAYKRDQDANN